MNKPSIGVSPRNPEIPQMASPETPHPRSIQIHWTTPGPFSPQTTKSTMAREARRSCPGISEISNWAMVKIHQYMYYIYIIYICQRYLIFRDDVSYRFTYWTMEPSKWASAQIWEFFKIGESALLVLGLCLSSASYLRLVKPHSIPFALQFEWWPHTLMEDEMLFHGFHRRHKGIRVSQSCWCFWCRFGDFTRIPETLLLLQKGLACRMCARLLVAIAGRRCPRWRSHGGCHAMTQKDRKGQVQACRAEGLCWNDGKQSL